MKYLITIYQPLNPTFRVDKSVNTYFVDDYKVVFKEEVDESVYGGQTDNQILEGLFTRFNMGNYPESYKGHSLSVGDIVRIELVDPEQECFIPDEDKVVPATMREDAFICCNFGWEKIDLTSEEAYWKAADAKLFDQMEGR